MKMFLLDKESCTRSYHMTAKRGPVIPDSFEICDAQTGEPLEGLAIISLHIDTVRGVFEVKAVLRNSTKHFVIAGIE